MGWAVAGVLLSAAAAMPCAADILPLERGRTELVELDNGDDDRFEFRYHARGQARVRVTIREPTILLPSIPPVRFHVLHREALIVETLPLGRVILDMTLVEGDAPLVWIRGPLRPYGAWAADVDAPATEIPDYW
jgi:hypothetical protein